MTTYCIFYAGVEIAARQTGPALERVPKHNLTKTGNVAQELSSGFGTLLKRLVKLFSNCQIGFFYTLKQVFVLFLNDYDLFFL